MVLRDPVTGKFAAKIDPRSVRMKWFIDNVVTKINLTLHQRMEISANLIRDRVVQNISKRVTFSGGRVTGRSKPGEYPRLETGVLQKSIFADVREMGRGAVEGYVGTTVDYGLRLEQKMDRKLLEATMHEMLPTVRKIITARIE